MRIVKNPDVGPCDATGRFVSDYGVRGTAAEVVELYEWLRDTGACADHRQHPAARGYFVGGHGTFDLRRWDDGLAHLVFEDEALERRFAARFLEDATPALAL